LRTTLIAGFPGETKDDVEEVKDFLRKIQFDRAGIFTYSHEENTAAYELEDNIPAKVKQRRAEEIMEVQRDISYRKNLEKEGKIFKVLIDREESGHTLDVQNLTAWMWITRVLIKSSRKLTIGNFVDVQITKAYDYDLEGEVFGGGEN